MQGETYMLVYVEKIYREKRSNGVDTLVHQKWSGANYYDGYLKTVPRGISSTTAMGKEKMANEELDLTLRLGFPNPTIVDTRLSLATPANTAQRTNVDGGSGENNDFGDFLSLGLSRSGNDAGTCNYVGVNIRVYSYVYTHLAGTVETLNFVRYAMAPSPVTPHVSHLNRSPNATGTSGSGGSSEEVRRCTNRNCNAVNTPLWRRGPLGPKSLCNACGIKFMKEEKKRNERN